MVPDNYLEKEQGKHVGRMAAKGSSIGRLLCGETGKKGAPSEMVTMDLLGGCGGGSGHSGSAREDEVIDLEMKVPNGRERQLDLLSGKTLMTPRHHGAQNGQQDLNLPPPAASAAVCTLDMVRSALEHASARRSATSPARLSSSATSTSSSSSSVGKHHRSSPASPSMCAAACPSCHTYVLFFEPDPRCPSCSSTVPPQVGRTIRAATNESSRKKPRIDLNVAADETE